MPQNKKDILRFVGWFFVFNAILFWLLGYGYLEKILLSPSLFENTIVDFTSLTGKTVVIVFAVVNYLCYMTALAFFPAMPILLIAYFIPIKRLIWLFCIGIGTLSLMLLIINNNIFSMFKFHLNTQILSLLFETKGMDVFEFSMREYVTFFTVLGVVFFIEICVAYVVWTKIIIRKKLHFGKTLATFWLGGFLFSYFMLMLSIDNNNNLFSQQTPNLPLYNQLLVYLIPDKNAADILYRYSEEHFSQPIFSDEKMNYPQNPLLCSRPENPPNIILIMVDSLRYDSLKDHMPNLNKFANKAWQFNNHLSGGNATQAGLFSIFYSIPANYWTAALKHKIPPVFMQLLLKYGYLTKIVWSSEMVNPPFHQTIYHGLSDLNIHGAPGDDVGQRDQFVTEQAIRFLQDNHQKQPLFLNLFYDAPHAYCQDQSYPTPYQPSLEQCSRIAMTNDVDAKPYYNRYLNAVNFVDGELAKLLTNLEKLGYLKNSIIIITSDHGQEFNDNKQNYWGHAGNFTKAQVQVPLIIYWPNSKPRTIDYLTSSYDIVPTLQKRVFQCQNPIIDYSIGQDLLVKHNRLPFVISASYSNLGLIEPDRLTTFRTSGEIFIRNPNAEPQPDAKPRLSSLKKALQLMRLYFVKS
ncbi:DUF3413 domain-containing protein [Legionella sp. W05-934-2]|uniref:DUF3413 domain-containing protein n=1 Tax=Legionella sp. W05-934-2 TaxID=1198649 RepID=UPI003461FDC9